MNVIRNWMENNTEPAYHGAKAGAELVHVQFNLQDNQLMAINTARGNLPGLTARVRVTDLAGRTLLQQERPLITPANSATSAGEVALESLLAGGGMVLVALELTDSAGSVLSRNFYWRGREPAAYLGLNALAPAKLGLQARVSMPDAVRDGGNHRITLNLANEGTGPALAIKFTVLDKAGARVLPAYFEDNYVSLLPGERRTLTVRVPASAEPAAIGIRGWNTAGRKVAIRP
ncbi:MAG: glycoside hydrolase family 2 protein [Novosphingobium sp.]